MALLGLSLLLTAAPAQADTVSPSTAPPIRTLSYNICGSGGTSGCDVSVAGNEDRYAAIVDETSGSGWNADFIFLVEVCKYQYTELESRLSPRGYRGNWVATKNAADLGSNCRNPATGVVSDYGMAIFVRGVIVNGDYDLELDSYAAIQQDMPDGYAENIRTPCIKAWVQNRLTWSCSVHLYWGNPNAGTPGNGWKVMQREAVKLSNQVKAWEAEGIPVVLGGDFNSSPQNDVMDYFYDIAWDASGSSGTMTEGDTLEKCTSPCRQGEYTKYNSPAFDDNPANDGTPRVLEKKIDYTFFSSAHFKGEVSDVMPEPHRSPTNTRFVSDHLPVRAAAYWEDCGAPGADAGAVFRRDANGNLHRYAGVPSGDGAVLAKPCKVGSGWKTMKHVARQGTTLVAVDGAGLLWHYGVGADGSYSGANRTQAGSGFGSDDLLVAPGDWDADGTADLITRTANQLWLHRGTGADSYAPREPLADLATWEIVRSMVAGDFVVGTGSPGPELITVSKTGHLLLRTRDEVTGALSAPKEIGTGWGVYDTALIGPGSLDADGRPDLVGRDDTGKLFYYKCDDAGGYAPRVQIGSSFPAGEMLF